ncbi:hypothetical protein BaRGS_00024429 [Batillaria attramentaria]|uniref:CUB domain-containing protein n=1 Tax=Batillaria attramentaria TaxID=370345 RepID=A0ABD0KB49_9CAEN
MITVMWLHHHPAAMPPTTPAAAIVSSLLSYCSKFTLSFCRKMCIDTRLPALSSTQCAITQNFLVDLATHLSSSQTQLKWARGRTMEYHKARSLCFIFYAVWSSCVSSAQNDCGGLFTSLDGTIQSPAYPENYPPNQDCVYRIIQPEEYRITLTFDTFDLQGDLRNGSNACPFDFVQIRDGDSENAPRLLHACGSKPNTTSMIERSFKNAMWIRFVSDGSESGAGFHANYTSEILQDKFLLSPVTGRHIVRVDLETLSFATIPNLELFHPFAVDYDPVDKRVFWTDLHTQGIFSANLDGTFSGTVKILNSSCPSPALVLPRMLPTAPELPEHRIEGTVQVISVSIAVFRSMSAYCDAKPSGIAFDPLSRLVFYTDAGNDVIAMVAASGSWERTIISENLDKPLAIVVDTMNGVLFWTDRGTPEKIERANYDGTERKVLHDTYLFLPDALALDLPNNRLFWVNQRMDNGFVESSDLDGNNRQQLYSLDVGKHWLFGLAFYHDQFYVTDWTPKRADTNESRILRLNADGSGGKVMLTFTSRLNDIHVVAEDSWERGPNGCGSNNGNCTHICVPAAGNTSKCLCPDQATDCFPTGLQAG